MENENNKIAILSHIFPPAPSGQAVVLHRLLKEVPPEKYCLATVGQESGNATQVLPGKRCQLDLPVKRWERFAKWSGVLALLLATWQARRRAKQIEKMLRRENCKVLIACSGDLLDVPAGAIAAERAGVAFVPYFFDDYLNQWTGWRRKIAEVFERRALSSAAGAIVPNEFLGEEYNRRYKVSCAVIRNPVNLPELARLDTELPVNATETAIVYTGAIYHAHYDAFRNIIAAMDQLEGSNLKLHLYTAQTAKELEANGISGPRVVHHPHVPQHEIIHIQRGADILFLPLAFNSPINEVIRTSAPGKMGEYLAVGKPILAHVPPGSFVGWYLEKHQCGIVIDNDNLDELAGALNLLLGNKQLRDEMGRRGRERAEIDFDIRIVQRRFMEYIESVEGAAA